MTKTKSNWLTFLIVLVFILLGLVKDSNPDNEPKEKSKQGSTIKNVIHSIPCSKCLSFQCPYLFGAKNGLSELETETLLSKLLN